MKTKKIISLLLTAVLLISCVFCVPSSAIYKQDNHFRDIFPELYELEESGEKYPTVIFPGINHSPYFVANENGDEQSDKNGDPLESSLLLLNKDFLKSDIIKTVPSLLLSLFFQRDFGLTKKIEKLVSDLMGYMEVDESGTPKYNLITKKYYNSVGEMSEDDRDFFYKMLPIEPLSDVYGEENIYLYTFPLFGDPMDSVPDIDNYIQGVLDKTGAEKVNIATVSLGGTMLTAYLEEGKTTDKINKIVNMVSLMNGTDILADFLDRDFNDSDEFVHSEYFPLVFEALSEDSGLGHLVNIVLRILPQKLFNSIISTAYGVLHRVVLVNNPEFWASVPAERYEEIANRRITNPTLRAKTDKFHNAQLNLKSNLLELSKNGVKVYNICGSDLKFTDGDYSFFGIVASNSTTNSDGIIPVQSTSLGATTVPAGTQFDEAYLASHNSKYISPTKSVDASTCLFPDTTWFFMGQHHEVGRADVVIRLITLILNGSIEDVNSTELFPQFNGARNTRSLVRTNGYIDLAFDGLSNEALLEPAAAAELRTATDEAVAMLNCTIADSAKAKEATAKLEKALESAGLRKGSKESFKFSSLRGLEYIDNIIYRTLKGKGFSER